VDLDRLIAEERASLDENQFQSNSTIPDPSATVIKTCLITAFNHVTPLSVSFGNRATS